MTLDDAPFPHGAGMDLYRAAMGLRSQDYYLRQFGRFDAAGRTRPSWNWAAFAFTLHWLVWRRMWGPARMYLAAWVLVALWLFGPVGPTFNEADSAVWPVLGGVLAVAYLLPGLYGNTWYYNDCNHRIALALRSTLSEADACEALMRQAHSPGRGWALAGVSVLGLAWVVAWASLVWNAPAAVPASLAPASPGQSEAPIHAASVPAVQASAPLQAATMPATELASEPLASAPASSASAPLAPEPPASAARVPAKAGPSARPWYVQVGAFAQDTNAQQLRARLEAAGQRVRLDPSPAQPGRLTRVRVGPFHSKAEAQAAAEELKSLEVPAVLVRP